MDVLTDDDLKHCVVEICYTAINPTSFKRDGEGPTIKVMHDDSCNFIDCSRVYQKPIIKEDSISGGGKKQYVVRVWDPMAVDQSHEELLGDWRSAAVRCEEAILEKFSGARVYDSFSQWHP